MQYIEETTSTSAINVTLIAEDTIKPNPDRRLEAARRGHADAVQALVKFLQGFVNFVIYLILLVLPILIRRLRTHCADRLGIVALVGRRKSKEKRSGEVIPASSWEFTNRAQTSRLRPGFWHFSEKR